MDRLTVKGLGKADGTYEFDLGNLVSLNGSEALTTRERHQIKLATGIRGAEIQESVAMLDAAVLVQIVAILLTRNGKDASIQRLWDCRFLIADDDEKVNLDDHRLAVLFQMGELAEASDDEGEIGSPPA